MDPPAAIAFSLECQECSATWTPEEATRWRAYLTESDPVLVILYCPQCARREFDE